MPAEGRIFQAVPTQQVSDPLIAGATVTFDDGLHGVAQEHAEEIYKGKRIRTWTVSVEGGWRSLYMLAKTN